MAIEGLKEVVATLRFRCPAGIPPEGIIEQIARGGICVALGLMPYAKDSDITVVDVLVTALEEVRREVAKPKKLM